MQHDCPFHIADEERKNAHREQVDKCQSQIEDSMRALGLLPENFAPMVRACSITMARYNAIAEEVACLPLTYIEKSREGNTKPVSRPEYATLNAVGSLLTAQLKQLGIYVSTEKVNTKTKDEEQSKSPLSKLMNEFMV